MKVVIATILSVTLFACHKTLERPQQEHPEAQAFYGLPADLNKLNGHIYCENISSPLNLTYSVNAAAIFVNQEENLLKQFHRQYGIFWFSNVNRINAGNLFYNNHPFHNPSEAVYKYSSVPGYLEPEKAVLLSLIDNNNRSAFNLNLPFSFATFTLMAADTIKKGKEYYFTWDSNHSVEDTVTVGIYIGWSGISKKIPPGVKDLHFTANEVNHFFQGFDPSYMFAYAQFQVDRFGYIRAGKQTYLTQLYTLSRIKIPVKL